MLDYNLYSELRIELLRIKLEMVRISYEKKLDDMLRAHSSNTVIFELADKSVEEEQKIRDEIRNWEYGRCELKPL